MNQKAACRLRVQRTYDIGCEASLEREHIAGQPKSGMTEDRPGHQRQSTRGEEEEVLLFWPSLTLAGVLRHASRACDGRTRAARFDGVARIHRRLLLHPRPPPPPPPPPLPPTMSSAPATHSSRASAPVYAPDQVFVPVRTHGHAPTAEELRAAHPELESAACAKLPAGVPMPRVILLRHGETAWSLSGQHTGRTNLRLTPHGEELVRQLGPHVVGPDPSPSQNESALLTPHHLRYVFSSPRGRSQHTLQLLLEHLDPSERSKIPPVEIRQECREWDYGLFEGKTPAEARAVPGYAKWDIWHEGSPDDPEDPASPGESAESMQARIDHIICQIRLLQRAAAHGYLSDDQEAMNDERERSKSGHRCADILIVAHGHFNRYVRRGATAFLFCPLSNQTEVALGQTFTLFSFLFFCFFGQLLRSPLARPAALAGSALRRGRWSNCHSFVCAQEFR